MEFYFKVSLCTAGFQKDVEVLAKAVNGST